MSDTISTLERAEEAVAVLPPKAWPDVSHIVTEDEAPVDNPSTGSGHRFPSEKQQRLLTEPLYVQNLRFFQAKRSFASSWEGPGEGRSFLAAANVGLFADETR